MVTVTQMLVAQVIVGFFTNGEKGMLKCPSLPGEEYKCYHSLVNEEDDPSIFVVQHSCQAYPSYIITYH